MDRLARGEKIEPGSAANRQTSAPAGGPETLTDASLYDGSLAKPIAIPGLPEKTA